MVTCHFNGRLGNQMFQIAAAYSLALDNNDVARFPITSSPYITNVFKNVLEFKSNEAIQFKLHHENGFHYSPIQYTNNLMLIGFYQSEKYFINNKYKIYDLFKPDDKIINTLKYKHKFILLDETCSIHVRRGDYIAQFNNHPPCTLEYYKEAMSLFSKHVKFLIFSDDIIWCKQNFIGDQFTFIENNPDYFDLYLMAQCTHNIIANSSFSWWGAWLNQNPNKIVIAPNKWFGPGLQHHSTKDLIPNLWTKI